MSVTFDVSGLDALAARMGRVETAVTAKARALVLASAEDVARIAQAHVLVDTGALRHSIGFDLDPDGMGATIGPWTGDPTSEVGGHADDGGRAGSNTAAHGHVDYGPYVEYGTAAHEIRSRDGGVLAWQGPDGPVFARAVQHPGTTAHPFMAPAAEHVRPLFAAGLAKIGTEAVL